MPRAALSPEQLRWLQENHKPDTPIRDFARHLKVDPDTVRRALTRLGLREYEGAKFTPTPSKPKTWDRPCIRCRAKETRPKWQFLCESCTRYSDRRFAAKSACPNPHESQP